MKARHGAALILALTLLTAAIPPQSNRVITAEERLYGLSLIWQEATYNFAYFDQVPELDWDAAYREFIPLVLQAEDPLEYYRLLQRFAALLNDGHTDVWLPREISEARDWSYPWLLTRRVEGRAYVRSVGASLEEVVPVGSVITHVDGRPLDEYVASEVIPFVAASTEHDRLDRAYRDLLHGPAGTAVTVRYETADGTFGEVTLARDRWTRDDAWTPDPNAPFVRFQVTWPEPDVALVVLNTFDDPGLLDDWAAALPELAEARALILDIRANGGGSSGIGYGVASHLTHDTLQTSAWRTREHRAAFKAWGRWDEDRADWASLNRWHDGGTHGQVAPAEGIRVVVPTVVLHDHATFSAAEDFLVALDGLPHVTTMGRPTGGSTGQPLILELPGGGGARICTKRDSYPDGRDFVGVGIRPDFYVQPSLEDVRGGRDPAVALALDFLREEVGVQSGEALLRDRRRVMDPRPLPSGTPEE
jgi:carboxyl-terminal processing protease